MKIIETKEKNGILNPVELLPNVERIFDGKNHYCKEGENDPDFEKKKKEILQGINQDEQ